MWRPKRSVSPPLRWKMRKTRRKRGKRRECKEMRMQRRCWFKVQMRWRAFKVQSFVHRGQRSCWFKVQSLRFKEKQAADYKNFTQICSVAAGSRFKCADARSRFKVLSTEGSRAAGEKFKSAVARSKFKDVHRGRLSRSSRFKVQKEASCRL